MKCEHCGKSVYSQFLDKTRRPADRLYTAHGQHPLLKKASDLVKLAEEYEQEVRRLKEINRKRLKPEYSYEVVVCNEDEKGWFTNPRIPEGTEMIKVNATLLNQHIFERHLKKYGSLSMPPDEKKRSVSYYRKHGILFYDGGGHVTIEAEQPCSDEEWEQLKQGNIPKKFLR